MDDLLVRVAVLVGVIAVALAVSRSTRPLHRPSHPRVDLRGTSLPNGLVVFTNSDCAACAQARAALKTAGVAFREVTYELEPGLFASIGVESVPLIVARDGNGVTIGQISGKPQPRRLRSLAAAASASTVPDS